MRRLRYVTTLMVAVMIAGAACSKKSGGDSGGGPTPQVQPPPPPPPPPDTTPPTNYQGKWRYLHTATSGNGICDIIGKEHEVGNFTVEPNGYFTLHYHTNIDGWIGPGDGAVNFRITDSQPCGRGTGTGKCDSFGYCEGTWTATGTSPHSGTWRFRR